MTNTPRHWTPAVSRALVAYVVNLSPGASLRIYARYAAIAPHAARPDEAVGGDTRML